MKSFEQTPKEQFVALWLQAWKEEPEMNHKTSSKNEVLPKALNRAFEDLVAQETLPATFANDLYFYFLGERLVKDDYVLDKIEELSAHSIAIIKEHKKLNEPKATKKATKKEGK